MFDIGFPELLLIAVVGLLVIGPQRLPEALRTLGMFIGRTRRQFGRLRDELEQELGADEIRQKLHNESIMSDVEALQRELRTEVGGKPSSKTPATAAPTSPTSAPDPRPPTGENDDRHDDAQPADPPPPAEPR